MSIDWQIRRERVTLELVPGKLFVGDLPYLKSATAEIRVTGSLLHEVRLSYMRFSSCLPEPIEIWLENFSRNNVFQWEVDLAKMMDRVISVRSLSDDQLAGVVIDVITDLESAITEHPSFFLIGIFDMKPDSMVEVSFRVSRARRWPAVESRVRSSDAMWH